MAVTIAVAPNYRGYLCDVTLAGLTAGIKYDVLRLAYRNTAEAGEPPSYEQWLPDRRAYWRAVAHRVGWTPAGTTANFRDFEPPVTPFAYFVVETSNKGPTDWDYDQGDYPLGRGVLGSVVDIAYNLAETKPPAIVVRSTVELGKWVQPCVYDLPKLTYTARGSEFGVIHRQYPVYVGDTREARRGEITFVTDGLAQYHMLREIVFPQNGRLQPVVFDAIGDTTLLALDNMCVMPLDVDVEQATHADADKRFITVAYVEIDATIPLPVRAGDNDSLVNAPKANFTVSPGNIQAGDAITLTDTSTGQYDRWEWSWSHSSGPMGHSRLRQPPVFHWWDKGEKTVRLRIYESIQAGNHGADVTTKTVRVH